MNGTTYDELVSRLTALPDVTASKMFGMPTLKVAGKAFAGNRDGNMVFKQTGDAHAQVLALPLATVPFGPLNNPLHLLVCCLLSRSVDMVIVVVEGGMLTRVNERDLVQEGVERGPLFSRRWPHFPLRGAQISTNRRARADMSGQSSPSTRC